MGGDSLFTLYLLVTSVVLHRDALLIYNQIYATSASTYVNVQGEQSQASPAGDRGKGRPCVCMGHGVWHGWGSLTTKSLRPLKEEPPSEADKRPQSWASFSFPVTARWPLTALPLVFPLNTPIVILPLQASGSVAPYRSLSQLQPLFPPFSSPAT